MKIVYPTDIDSVVPYYGRNRFFIYVEGTPNHVEMSTSYTSNYGFIVRFVVDNVKLDQNDIADLMDSIAVDVENLVELYFENGNRFTDEGLKLIDKIQTKVSNVKTKREILEVRANDYKAIEMIMDYDLICPWDIYECAVEDEFCGDLTMDLIHFVGEPEQFRDAAWQVLADKIESCDDDPHCIIQLLDLYVTEGDEVGIDVLTILEKLVGDIRLTRVDGDPYFGNETSMKFSLSEIYDGVHEEFGYD